MESKLERRDLGFIGICLLVTVVCLIIGVHYFYRAFPEASIDFRVTREQAQTQATDFLATRGFDLSQYRHSAIFRHDDQTKTFLERELGLEGATQTIGNPVQLWRWHNRWVRELEKEEFQVDITTTGQLVGFSHLIEEEAPGASLNESAARALAEDFLATALARDLSALEFVEAQSSERPERIDHTFTWKLRDFEISEGTYRYDVTVQGDTIGGFGEYLKVPEAWQRDFKDIRSRNDTTGMIAALFMLLTMLAMLAVFFGRIRAQDIRWRTALVFGGIAAVLNLLAELNNFPVTQFYYATTDTYGSFLTQQLLFGLLTALGQGIFIFFLTAAAEPLYRRHYQGQIQLGAQFTPQGMRTKRFLLGTILGLALTAFFFAYQTIFYVVADRLGAWSPAQIPYSEMVNTYIPWIVVLLIGFMPAVSEEFMSRAFSIPFLHKYLKSRWAAVVLSAIIWGFAHAGYPQQPFWIRGVEVGIAGIIIGYIFLRFGLLAPLVWHYTVDALYTALILLRSSNDYFVVSAALSAGLMLVPLAVAIVLYVRQRRFADPAPLLNERDIPPEPEEAADKTAPAAADPVPTFTYIPLTPRRITISAAVVLASLGVFAIDYEQPLDFVAVEMTRSAAEARAILHFEEAGADPAAWEIVTFYHNQPNDAAIKYILEREAVTTVNRLYSSDLLASLWITRFFRYGEKEEYQVAIHPETGALYSMRHLLPEETAGADLDEKSARAIAVEYLRAFAIDPDLLDLKESSSERHPARRDHRFVFEAREGDSRNIDELRYRVRIDIAGDKPANILRSLKVPEAWQRERDESTALKTTLFGLIIALVVGIGLHGCWLLISHIRNREMHWAPLVKIAGVGIALFLLNYLNDLTTFERGYDTQLTQSIFTIMQLFGAIAGGLGIGVVVVAGLALATSLYPHWPDRLRAARRVPELRDALVGVVLLLIASESWGHLRGWIDAQFITYNPSPGNALPLAPDSYLPLWGGLTAGLAMAAMVPILAGFVLYYGRQVLKKPRYWILAGTAIGLISSGSSAVHLGEFYFAFVSFIATVAFAAVGVVAFLRNNLLAYVLFGLSTSLQSVKDLAQTSVPAFHLQAIALSVLVLLVIFYLWRRAPSAPP